jgi:hypothetical protein
MIASAFHDRDGLPAGTGYVVELSNGERLHVWPEVGMVVSELASAPIAAAVSSYAGIPLTEASSAKLRRLWARALKHWRRPR